MLFALLYFLDGSGFVSAMVPAVLVHELGHILALRICRCRIKRVSITLFGVELDYAPQIDGIGAVFAFLSGPLLGTVFAVASCSLDGAFWRMSGTLSFLLSLFNCLPILPLDGGRTIAALLPRRQAGRISSVCAFLLLFFCIAVSFRFNMLP